MKRNDRVAPAGDDAVAGLKLEEQQRRHNDIANSYITRCAQSRAASALLDGHTVRIYYLGDEGRSLTGRDGALGLAVTDVDDPAQEWVILDSPYGRVNGQDGPYFAVVNKNTKDAIGVSGHQDGHLQAELVALYHELGFQDQSSVLWTTEGQRQDGFRRIRPLSDMDMCLHLDGGGSLALRKDKSGDGCCLAWADALLPSWMNWRRCKGGEDSRRRSLWKMVRVGS